MNDFYYGATQAAPSSTVLNSQVAALDAASENGQAAVITQAQSMGTAIFASQVNASPSTLSDAQFVTNLYEAFLQRGPDEGGFNFWVGQAAPDPNKQGSGPTHRQNVLKAFWTSTAFEQLAGTLYKELYWVTADALGTPRMIIDKSGSLASVKRHDYLPFGEELPAGMGGRSAQWGYASDDVRQKFTEKERDGETGLDYFEARYYSSAQGRFNSPDEFTGGPVELFQTISAANSTFYADIADPQSLNKYHYCLNNPLRYTDANGHQEQEKKSVSQRITEGVKETVNGASSAVSEDNDLGEGGGPQNTVGRLIGHGLALAQSTAEIAAGAIAEVGGTLLDSTGGLAPAGVLVNGVGAVAIAHGGAVGANALHNIFSENKGGEAQTKDGTYAPDRELPRDSSGRPVPESENPHTQLGTRQSRSRSGERYTQGREFGRGGRHVRDVDFTNHGRPDHTNPHQHGIDPHTGKRGRAEPVVSHE